MTRRATPAKKLLLALVLVGGPLAVFLAWQLSWRNPTPHPRRPFAPPVHAVHFHHKLIYHSPQTPGYTAWVGAWTMPDRSLMTAFTQATGPVDPRVRGLAPKRVLSAFAASTWDPRFDFWNLSLAVKYLRSTDGGAHWRLFRSDSFKALYPHGYTPQATIALRDGTLVRRVNGADLRFDPSVPHTAYLQRLAPGAKSWSAPQTLLDPDRYLYQLTRLQYLHDGRLIATGVYNAIPSTRPASALRKLPRGRLLLMVSSDEGRTWTNALTESDSIAKQIPGNEWDAAELPNGNLVAVMRTFDSPTSKHQVLKQALLKKKGSGWVVTDVAPMPPGEPTGHPELLTTREGPVLYIAQSGIEYTRDGVDWQPLKFAPRLADTYYSPYYPRAVQTSDGVVHVFGHVGFDDQYGERDQSIVMDEFRLAIDRPAPPPGG